MATLERRVQILFDAERYAELEAEASDLRMSVGAFVRQAVDERISRKRSTRSEALARLFASADTDQSLGPIDWSREKDAFERESLGVEA